MTTLFVGVTLVVWLVGRPWTVPVDQYTTDQGVTFRVKFPGRASQEVLQGIKPLTKGYVYHDANSGISQAAWVWLISEDEQDAHTPGDLLFKYAGHAGNIRGGVPVQSREQNGLRTAQAGGRMDNGKGFIVVRTTFIGNRMYALRIQGPNVTPDHPEVKRFLDSLETETTPPPLPPVAPAPGDDLRSLGRRPPFFALAWASEGRTFCTIRPPSYSAEMRRDHSQEGLFHSRGRRLSPPPGLVTCYAYPTFAPVAAFQTPVLGYRLALDRDRLYLAACTEAPKNLHPDSRDDPVVAGDLHVFDLPPLTPGRAAEGPAELKPTRVIPLGAKIHHLSVSTDGRYVYALAARAPADVRALRWSTATLEQEGEIQLQPNTELMCPTPDGRTIYTASSLSGHQYAHPQGTSLEGLIEVIDVESWRVNRSFKVFEDPFQLEVGPEGRLYVTSGSNQSRDLVILDPAGGGRPLVRRVGGVYMNSHLRVTPDGERAYLGGTAVSPSSITSLDLDEAFENARRRQLGEARDQTDFPAGGMLYLSPDGKCLITRTGLLFWLTGAGPPPEIKPEPYQKPAAERRG